MGKRKGKDRVSAEALERRLEAEALEAARRKKRKADEKAKRQIIEKQKCTSAEGGTSASHVWETQGKLGLVLQQRGETPDDPEGVCITTVTDPALRETLRNKGIAPGRLDFVIKVAGMPTETKSYVEVINAVKNAERPLTIVFGEEPDETSDEESEEGLDDEADEGSDNAEANNEAPTKLQLSMCGNAEVNGIYAVDGIRDGVPCFRKVDGELTIERDAAPGQLTQWAICRNYGFDSLCYVDSESDRPPAHGWAVADGVCEGPPPVITSLDEEEAAQ